jgi:hypothetical protein
VDAAFRDTGDTAITRTCTFVGRMELMMTGVGGGYWAIAFVAAMAFTTMPT